MTARLVTHKTRKPWSTADAFVVARVCDADAQKGAAYWAPAQLWDRIEEGKRRDRPKQ